MKILLKVVLLFLLSIGSTIIIGGAWLKTAGAKIAITNYLNRYIKEEFGVSIEIDNLAISLPIIIKAKKISLKDNLGDFIKINNFKINILPSLFSLWEITICKISADKIIFLRAPEIIYKNTISNPSVINPNILIKEINIKNFVFDKTFTHLKNDFVLSINSYFRYNLQSNSFSFSNNSELILPQYEYIKNANFEIVGNYDITRNYLDLKLNTLKIPNVEASGNLVLRRNDISAKVQYSSNILEVLLKNLFGELKNKIAGKVIISGTINNLQISTDGVCSLEQESKEYIAIPNILWHGDFVKNNKGAKGNLNINAKNINVKSNLTWKDNKLYLPNLIAQGQYFKKEVNLIIDLKRQLINGRINVNATSLKDFSTILPFIYDGSLHLEGVIPNNNQQALLIKGSITNFLTKFGNFSSADINLNIWDLWNYKLKDSKITLKSVTTEDINIKEIILVANSKNNYTEFKAYIVSNNPFPINLEIESKISTLSGSIIDNIIINKLSGKLANSLINNTTDIVFKLKDRQQLEARKIKIDNGYLDLFLDVYGNNINLEVKAENIPLLSKPNSLPIAFKNAVISGSINTVGTLEQPKLVSSLLVSNIELNKYNKFNLMVDLEVNRDLGKFTSSIKQSGTSLAEMNLNIPILFLISPFKFVIKEKDKFCANLKISNPTDIFFMLPLPLGHSLSGVIIGNLEASGTIISPVLNGKIFLSNGQYKYKPQGIMMKNIKAYLIAKSNKLLFSDIKACDIFGKELSGEGNLLITDNLSFNFRFHANDFSLINSSYLQGKSNIEIQIEGDKHKAKATGKIDLGPLDIKIPEKFSHDIPTLNITKVITEEDKIKYIKAYKPYDFTLDLIINTLNKVYVRGWGINTLLNGNLHITGPISDPYVKGTLRSARGTYKEFGRTLNVTEGILTFDGSVPPSPFLRIVGTVKESNTKIRLILSGPIIYPDINIEAIPSMSEEDALSLLLFGKNPENISAFQGLQLADSLYRLSGKGGSFDPLGTSRKLLGVDDISFKSDKDDPTKTLIGVGKYLTDKVYVEIQQGTSATGVKTTVEVELTPKISVESTKEEKGGSTFGVNWRLDY